MMRSLLKVILYLSLVQLWNCTSSLIVTDEMAYDANDSLETVEIPTFQATLLQTDSLGQPKIFTTEPEVLTKRDPQYPAEALQAGVNGDVWVKSLVTKSGSVKRAIILKTSDRIFNKPALRAAMAWTFRPATIGNQPVAVWMAIRVSFRVR